MSITALYAQPSDLIARFDSRILGDLVGDAGVRTIPVQLLTDPNIITALNDAASMVNAACQIGERYTQAQLSALTGADQSLLFRLCCDLAFQFLCQRRGIKPNMYDEAVKRSDELLAKLKDGSLIFNVPSNVAAGVASCEFPSLVTLTTVNTLRESALRFFPEHVKQVPASGGFR